MKKISIIHHYGGIGGAGISLLHIANTINKLGGDYMAEVFCPKKPLAMYELLKENGIKTVGYSFEPQIFSHYSGSKNCFFSIKSLKNLCKILMKTNWNEIKEYLIQSQPYIVVLNSMTLAWLGKPIKKLGFKVICFHRETFIESFINIRTNIIKRQLRKYFDSVVFISNFDMNSIGKINGEKFLITDKVDAKLYSQSEQVIKNKDFKVLYLGGFTKYKGPYVIIKAMKHLVDFDIKLVFVGNINKNNNSRYLTLVERFKSSIRKILRKDNKHKILRYISKYKLNDTISFVNVTKHPEELILNSDVVVFPSVSPHQSRPIYEAGFAKKPIIITSYKQTKEFAIDGFNCLEFNKNNSKELAKKILILKNDKDLYNTLAINNYNMAIKNHNLKTLSNQLKEVFDTIT